ncbi:MAG: Sulfate/thiosulfate import ATP-binding protein CysA [Nitrospirae bacterium]|nr:MAG: sulfate/thiosulfate ABC transporter ATP-binding protein [Nitrospira sp. OLB3]MBV6469313.1 Sulfate/thiosulfate import ATP-binding protein CysA [Nitrospirota bacterium]MCE7966479.1 ABC transporter ATP-binding protein [Nitrospira sp. NTP2]MCK6494386.1 ABC transporter ATP-binding protein [Nitrospira sp.]MEB2339904.1 ABC transporter ATP-binding protein [Nitrospirales bacterium]
MKIQVRGLTKKFGSATAVGDVSFDVQEGELLGLLGPSGSGKTTVLRLIAGLEVPTAGEIFIDGKRVNDLSVQDRNIGFVFQHYALFKHMTVFDNIAFGLKIKKWGKQEIARRVQELLSLMSLEGLGGRYPHQLSGGQRQRVAIARALAPRPSVLLMDEPFGAVDAKVRQELREWLIRLHTDLNVTSLFVTHDQEEAMEVSGRIIVFSKGKLEQAGSPADVYEEPATEFVARFIGSMNIVEGTVRRGQVQVGSLEFPAPEFPDGQTLQVGFRPYYVKVAEDPTRYRQQAKLRHIYFLGVAYRLEIETTDGLILRSRMNKEEFRRCRFTVGQAVSFAVTHFRILPQEGAAAQPGAGSPLTGPLTP